MRTLKEIEERWIAQSNNIWDRKRWIRPLFEGLLLKAMRHAVQCGDTETLKRWQTAIVNREDPGLPELLRLSAFDGSEENFEPHDLHRRSIISALIDVSLACLQCTSPDELALRLVQLHQNRIEPVPHLPLNFYYALAQSLSPDVVAAYSTSPIRSASIYFPLVAGKFEGCLARFELTTLGYASCSEARQVFIHPQDALLSLSSSFRQIFQDAPRTLKNILKPEQMQASVMVKIRRIVGKSEAAWEGHQVMEGGSGGGALLLGLYSVWTGNALLSNCSVTASFALRAPSSHEANEQVIESGDSLPDKACYPIGDLERKIEVIKVLNRCFFIGEASQEATVLRKLQEEGVAAEFVERAEHAISAVTGRKAAEKTLNELESRIPASGSRYTASVSKLVSPLPIIGASDTTIVQNNNNEAAGNANDDESQFPETDNDAGSIVAEEWEDIRPKWSGQSWSVAPLWVALGEAGIGKTTWLCSEARTLLNESQSILYETGDTTRIIYPIFLRVDHLSNAFGNDIKTLQSILLEIATPSGSAGEYSTARERHDQLINDHRRALLVEAFDTGRVAVLFEEFEMATGSQREQARRAIALLHSHGCPVYVTCRTSSWPTELLTDAEQRFYPRSWGRRYQSKYIENWFGEDRELATGLQYLCEHNTTLADLCSNPLLLGFICKLYETSDTRDELLRPDLTFRRSDILKECVTLHLSVEGKNLSLKKKEALGQMAWIRQNNSAPLTEKDILQVFDNYRVVEPLPFLNELANLNGIIQKRDQCYDFVYPLLQEYFAADYLARNENWPQTFSDHGRDGSWFAVFAMVPGCLRHHDKAPDVYLEALGIEVQNWLDGDYPSEAGGVSRRLRLLASALAESLASSLSGPCRQLAPQFWTTLASGLERLQRRGDPFGKLTDSYTTHYLLQVIAEWETSQGAEDYARATRNFAKSVLVKAPRTALKAAWSESDLTLILRGNATLIWIGLWVIRGQQTSCKKRFREVTRELLLDPHMCSAVRTCAARCQTDLTEVVKLLSLESNAEIRAGLLIALGSKHNRRTLQPLADAISRLQYSQSPCSPEAEALTFTLSQRAKNELTKEQLQQWRNFVGWILKAETPAREETQLHALSALAHLGGDEAVVLLTQYACNRSASPYLRARAVRGVGQLLRRSEGLISLEQGDSLQRLFEDKLFPLLQDSDAKLEPVHYQIARALDFMNADWSRLALLSRLEQASGRGLLLSSFPILLNYECEQPKHEAERLLRLIHQDTSILPPLLTRLKRNMRRPGALAIHFYCLLVDQALPDCLLDIINCLRHQVSLIQKSAPAQHHIHFQEAPESIANVALSLYTPLAITLATNERLGIRVNQYALLLLQDIYKLGVLHACNPPATGWNGVKQLCFKILDAQPSQELIGPSFVLLAFFMKRSDVGFDYADAERLFSILRKLSSPDPGNLLYAPVIDCYTRLIAEFGIALEGVTAAGLQLSRGEILSNGQEDVRKSCAMLLGRVGKAEELSLLMTATSQEEVSGLVPTYVQAMQAIINEFDTEYLLLQEELRRLTELEVSLLVPKLGLWLHRQDTSFLGRRNSGANNTERQKRLLEVASTVRLLLEQTISIQALSHETQKILALDLCHGLLSATFRAASKAEQSRHLRLLLAVNPDAQAYASNTVSKMCLRLDNLHANCKADKRLMDKVTGCYPALKMVDLYSNLSDVTKGETLMYPAACENSDATPEILLARLETELNEIARSCEIASIELRAGQLPDENLEGRIQSCRQLFSSLQKQLGTELAVLKAVPTNNISDLHAALQYQQRGQHWQLRRTEIISALQRINAAFADSETTAWQACRGEAMKLYSELQESTDVARITELEMQFEPFSNLLSLADAIEADDSVGQNACFPSVMDHFGHSIVIAVLTRKVIFKSPLEEIQTENPAAKEEGETFPDAIEMAYSETILTSTQTGLIHGQDPILPIRSESTNAYVSTPNDSQPLDSWVEQKNASIVDRDPTLEAAETSARLNEVTSELVLSPALTSARELTQQESAVTEKVQARSGQSQVSSFAEDERTDECARELALLGALSAAPSLLLPLPTLPPSPQSRYPSGENARVALENLANKNANQLTASVAWQLIAENRLSLAYCLAWSAEHHFGEILGRGLLSSLLRCLPLCTEAQSSNYVQTQIKEEVFALYELFDKQSLSGEDADAPARLLLLSSLLRPALLTPGDAHICYFLEELELIEQHNGCKALLNAIKEYQSRARSGLTLQWLQSVGGHSAWVVERQELQAEARGHIERAPTLKFGYQAAGAVWQRWLNPKGALEVLLQRVLQDKYEDAAYIETQIRQWANEDYVINQVQQQHSRNNQGIEKVVKIEFRAFDKLTRLTSEVIDLLRRWLTLAQNRPVGMSSEQSENASQMRTLLLNAFAHADREAREEQKRQHKNASLAHTTAWTFLQRTLETLPSLLRAPDDHVSTSREWNKDLRLYSDMARMVETLPRSVPEQCKQSPPLKDVLQFLTEDSGDWEHAFDKQMHAGNHYATKTILSVWQQDPSVETRKKVERYERERERKVESEQDKIHAEMQRARDTIEQYTVYGFLYEAERASLDNSVNQFVVAEVEDFRWVRCQLNRIYACLDDCKRRSVKVLNRRIGLAGVRHHDPVFTSIITAVKNSDFLTVYELIDYSSSDDHSKYKSATEREGETGGELTATLCQQIQDHFFPDMLTTIEKDLELDRTLLSRAIELLRSPSKEGRYPPSLGPLSISHVRRTERREAAAMLDAWMRIKSNREEALEELLTTILTQLGFDDVQVDASGSYADSELRQFRARTLPLDDANLCSMPQFGSDARGRYRILVIWGRPSLDTFFSHLNHIPPDEATLVLFMGRMSAKFRRQLANRCIRNQRFAITLDEVLLFFLCGEMGRKTRLRTLLICALPFTTSAPYTITPGYVSPEMFAGRSNEITKIFAPRGTCLLYGGRQLGKTALLREVVRRYHKPEDCCLVIFMDLREKSIGGGQIIGAVWKEIAQVLRENNVPIHNHDVEAVSEGVRNWLNMHPDGRILLLLDEADDFFREERAQRKPDGTPSYPNVLALNGLKMDTDFRFKVVFAGLHNVQRMARDPNTPLTHLQDPICIGPLLAAGSEYIEAVRLITRPLTALGYRFESENLPLRILGYTNYYPSLIQIFCRQLLEYLLKNHAQRQQSEGIKNSPPYLITSEDVDRAFRQAELSNIFQERFRITLDLDCRYAVIAYTMAIRWMESNVEIDADEARPLNKEFGITALRHDALREYPKAFGGSAEENSEETFEILLEEMVGLGVLRRTRDKKYTLRSPNILKMLGTADDCRRQLEHAIAQDKTSPYEPGTFRRVADINGKPVRSVLTMQQEAELFRSTRTGNASCFTMFGTSLSGLPEIVFWLQEAAIATNSLISLLSSNEASPEQIMIEINTWLVENKEQTQTCLLVVPPEVNWTPTTLEKTRTLLEATNINSSRRLVFLGDSKLAWRYTSDMSVHEDIVRMGDVTLSLRCMNPRSAREWILEDIGLVADDIGRLSDILKITGGWHELLRRFTDYYRAGAGVAHALTQIKADGINALRELMPQNESSRILYALKTLAELGQVATTEELCDYAAMQFPDALEISPTHSAHILAWAERLSIVHQTSRSERQGTHPQIVWEIDAWAADLLKVMSASQNKT